MDDERTIDLDVYDESERARLAAGRRWHDSPELQAARRCELKSADRWWRESGRWRR